MTLLIAPSEILGKASGIAIIGKTEKVTEVFLVMNNYENLVHDHCMVKSTAMYTYAQGWPYFGQGGVCAELMW